MNQLRLYHPQKDQNMSATVIALLQKLLNRTARSLLSYVFGSHPWVSYRQENLWQVIEEIASRHREWSVRLSEEIIRRDGIPDRGSFPMYYTRYNDLAIGFLAPRILEELQGTLVFIKQSHAVCQNDPELGMMLQEMEDELRVEIESLQQEIAGTSDENESGDSVAA